MGAEAKAATGGSGDEESEGVIYCVIYHILNLNVHLHIKERYPKYRDGFSPPIRMDLVCFYTPEI